MVAIDTDKTTLNFTEAAIGKNFKITVKAANPDPEYDADDTMFVAVLNVIDGYNVYNAAELSVFDNVSRTQLGGQQFS